MDFDLDDPTLLFRDDVLADPRPLYDTLRRRAPVWRLPGQESFLAIERLLGRTSRLALDPDNPPLRRRSIFLRRHTSLTVRIETARQWETV